MFHQEGRDNKKRAFSFAKVVGGLILSWHLSSSAELVALAMKWSCLHQSTPALWRQPGSHCIQASQDVLKAHLGALHSFGAAPPGWMAQGTLTYGWAKRSPRKCSQPCLKSHSMANVWCCWGLRVWLIKLRNSPSVQGRLYLHQITQDVKAQGLQALQTQRKKSPPQAACISDWMCRVDKCKAEGSRGWYNIKQSWLCRWVYSPSNTSPFHCRIPASFWFP